VPIRFSRNAYACALLRKTEVKALCGSANGLPSKNTAIRFTFHAPCDKQVTNRAPCPSKRALLAHFSATTNLMLRSSVVQ
jgi:hypothetical protein